LKELERGGRIIELEQVTEVFVLEWNLTVRWSSILESSYQA